MRVPETPDCPTEARRGAEETESDIGALLNRRIAGAGVENAEQVVASRAERQMKRLAVHDCIPSFSFSLFLDFPRRVWVRGFRFERQFLLSNRRIGRGSSPVSSGIFELEKETLRGRYRLPFLQTGVQKIPTEISEENTKSKQ
jgi:hypothetical protein